LWRWLLVTQVVVLLTDRLFAGWQVPVSLQMWLERPRLQQKRKQDEPETFLGFEGVYSTAARALHLDA